MQYSAMLANLCPIMSTELDKDWLPTEVASMPLHQKKELKVFSIPKHSITSKASVFPKNKIRN